MVFCDFTGSLLLREHAILELSHPGGDVKTKPMYKTRYMYDADSFQTPVPDAILLSIGGHQSVQFWEPSNGTLSVR